jgi:hypothetical protein
MKSWYFRGVLGLEGARPGEVRWLQSVIRNLASDSNQNPSSILPGARSRPMRACGWFGNSMSNAMTRLRPGRDASATGSSRRFGRSCRRCGGGSADADFSARGRRDGDPGRRIHAGTQTRHPRRSSQLPSFPRQRVSLAAPQPRALAARLHQLSSRARPRTCIATLRATSQRGHGGAGPTCPRVDVRSTIRRLHRSRIADEQHRGTRLRPQASRHNGRWR